ncbi:MAG: transposase [Desulfobacteraceae bacterium]|nr:transposase [Desulfobacteraceae bacterium]
MNQVTLILLKLLLRELGDAVLYGGCYIIALDPTYVAKVKGKMAGVQMWKQNSDNPDRGEQVTGHNWAIGGLPVRLGDMWRCFPIRTRLISGKLNPSHFVVSPKGECHPMSFREAVPALVFQAAGMLTGHPVCMVADAYFAKAGFINPLTEKSITLATRLRHDAVGWDDPVYKGRGRPPVRGIKWKLADLWEQGIRETVTVHIYGRLTEVSFVVREVWLRGVSQKVKVVVTEGISRPVLPVCTDLNMTVRQITELYAARFSIEITRLSGNSYYSSYSVKTMRYHFFPIFCIAY